MRLAFFPAVFRFDCVNVSVVFGAQGELFCFMPSVYQMSVCAEVPNLTLHTLLCTELECRVSSFSLFCLTHSLAWHHWKTLGGEAGPGYSSSCKVLPNLSRDGDGEKKHGGGEGWFDIQFPWCMLWDMISRNPKLSINIHWTLSPLSNLRVVKRKCED